MGEGCQKSKRLSYTAKFKHEVIRCAEEKGNHKAAATFGVDESNVRLCRKQGSNQRVRGVMKRAAPSEVVVGFGYMESHPGEHYRQIFQELRKQCFGRIRR
jgi:hypothetical protein